MGHHDGNCVKILKFQSVLYLFVKFQVHRPGNKELTIHPICVIITCLDLDEAYMS